MPQGQNAHLVLRDHETIQSYVACTPIRDDQLPQFVFDAPSDQRVPTEIVDGRLNRRDCVQRGRRILSAQELKRPFDVLQRAR